MSTATATRPAPPAGTPQHARGSQVLAGTGTLIRFILRRDRVRLPVWIVAIAGSTVLTAASFPDLYTSAEDRQVRAELMSNPGVRAFTGPGYGVDDYTFGAMMAQEMISWVGLFVALMSILLMVRHTRAEEETGRAELVRSAVVGRHAHTVAALLVVGGASLVIGLLTALGLGALGLESIDWSGSWLYGAAIASMGLVFAAVTAVTAQLTEYGRGAGGLAGMGFAVAYLLRAAGDAAEPGGNVLSWFSPVGWAQQTRVYVDDRWWPLLFPVALTAGLVVLALWLSTRRDVGAGLRRTRPGRPRASAWLSGPLGLAWRQHRASVLWWTSVLFLFGLGYGNLAADVETFVSELSAVQDWMGEVGGDSLIESFLSVILLEIALAATVFGVLTVLRPRAEESAGRAEPVLATAVSRQRWLGSHLTVALLGSAVMLGLTGLGLGISASAAVDDGGLLLRLTGGGLAYIPAVWVTIGLGAALYGLLPRATLLVWLVLVYALVIGMFGALFQFPDWTAELSPFGQVGLVPAEDMNWPAVLLLAAIAVALMVAGLVGFRRRDLESK